MLKNKLSITSLGLAGFIIISASYLFASYFFKVTNSNIYDIVSPGQSQIGFEDNEFEDINFELSGDNQWSLASDNFNTGQYSLKSGNITDNQSTSISIELNIIENGSVEFYYLVDAEYSTSGNEFYDGLYFSINGQLIDQFQTEENGNLNWRYFSHPVSQGPAVFTWSFTKDGSDGSTLSLNDCAWIDDIAFPISAPLFYDYYVEPPPQDNSSGLFSAFVHPQNNESNDMKAKGGVLVDFDLDGDLDLYFGYSRSHYFQNINGQFRKLDDIPDSGIRGIIAGDIDNNGYADILKWRYSSGIPHYLLLNLGNNNFEQTTYLNSSELEDLHSQGLSDFDLDGDLDLVAIEFEGTTQFYCYLNNGDESNIDFQLAYSYDQTDESSSRTLAIADFDNDGDQDVYVPRKQGKNWLFVNQTLTFDGYDYIYNENPENLFIEMSEFLSVDDQYITESGSMGYGAAWADYNNDNIFDLYLTNWGKNRLYRSDAANSFENIGYDSSLESDSLSNGAGWGDFNNDGYIDIWSNNFKRGDDLLLNPGLNNSEWTSYDTGFLSATQDVIPADYNNDGWLDMFTPGLLMAFGEGVENVQGYKYTSLLYKNLLVDSLSTTYNWLKLDLEGSKHTITNNGWSTKSNHSAIGARVIAHLSDMNISREIIAGKGHGSMDPLQLHFGLGTNISIDSLSITWPSKSYTENKPKTSTYIGPISANQSIRIVEDIGIVGSKGDINNDGTVNVIDVVEIVYIILDNEQLSAEQLWAVDMNYSSDINVIDITMLINFIFLP